MIVALNGFPGYSVDEFGNVYGKRVDVLKQVNLGSYLGVSLPLGNGSFKPFLVHRLVATAFLQNPNDLPEVNHIDGNKYNNNVSNLEWVSRSDNQLHRINVLKKGFDGERNTMSKLHSDQVLEIVKMHNAGVAHSQIAKMFNISCSTISDIIAGRSWNSVTGISRIRPYKRWKTI